MISQEPSPSLAESAAENEPPLSLLHPVEN